MQPYKEVSSYLPTVCSMCGKNKLSSLYPMLVEQWKHKYVERRNELIAQLNQKSDMSVDIPMQTYLHMPGFTDDMWHSVGIMSDCCKIEILSHIPYDQFQRDYNDANTTLPPDFDANSVTIQSVGNRESILETPYVTRTIGTYDEYNS